MEGCSDETYPIDMEEGVNNKEDHEKEKNQRMKIKV